MDRGTVFLSVMLWLLLLIIIISCTEEVRKGEVRKRDGRTGRDVCMCLCACGCTCFSLCVYTCLGVMHCNLGLGFLSSLPLRLTS